MVKIRYAELPAGLYVATEARGRSTIVYLLPGLTPAQRKDALTVARRSARLGHGPPLPAAELALALAADRVRTTGSTTVAALRKHPLLLVPLVLLVSAGIVAAMLSALAATAGPHGSSSGPASLLPATNPERPPGGAAGGHFAKPSPIASGIPALGASRGIGSAPGGGATPSPAPESMPPRRPGTGTTDPARYPPRQARPARPQCPKLRWAAFCSRP